jgi:acyl-CoA dehydrogenase
MTGMNALSAGLSVSAERADLMARAGNAAKVLREHAAEVDSKGIFPVASLAALRHEGLLGLLVPAPLGGLDGGLADLVAIAQVLGAACQSTAMIWVMHCQQVEVIRRHAPTALQERILRQVAEDGHYLASVTTEERKGGKLLAAQAELTKDGGLLVLNRIAPVITGGGHANGFLITMRDTPDAAANQVTLVYADRDQLSVEAMGTWDALGMRGTESHGYRLQGSIAAESVIGGRGGFRTVAVETMIPAAHLSWAACWLGAAQGAMREVVSAIRSARRPGGVDPASALHLERLGRVRLELELTAAYLSQVTNEVVSRQATGLSMDEPAMQVHLNTVKVAAAELAFSVVDRLIRLVGLSAGYLRTSELPLERYFRDLRSATLNNADDRLLVSIGSLSLLDRAVTLASLRNRTGGAMDGQMPLPGAGELHPEARLLLALAQPTPGHLDTELLREFLSAHGPELNWGWLLDQAARHSVLPLVSRALVQLESSRSHELRRVVPYEWLHRYVYAGNRTRNTAIGIEQKQILEALTERSLRYCVRKGAVLLDQVYGGDPGTRRIGDLDLLLDRADLAEASQVLRSLSYLQGDIDESGQAIREFDRVTQVFWKTQLTHVTLPFMKIAPLPEVEAFIVDPCLSVFPPGFDADPETDSEILSRRVATEVWSTSSWALDPADQILDHCVQFHAEATTLHYISIGKDLTVAKLLEVAQLFTQADTATISTLLERADRYRRLPSIYYTLHFTNLLYPGQIPAAALAGSRPASLDYLEEFGSSDGSTSYWPNRFFDRLFDQSSRSSRAVSRIPGPRARI